MRGGMPAPPPRDPPPPPRRLARPRFAPPRPARGVLQRARLHEAVARGLDAGVLLLVAPAGYGKTTVITQWLDESALPAAWLALNAAHRDPPALLGDRLRAVGGP